MFQNYRFITRNTVKLSDDGNLIHIMTSVMEHTYNDEPKASKQFGSCKTNEKALVGSIVEEICCRSKHSEHLTLQLFIEENV